MRRITVITLSLYLVFVHAIVHAQRTYKTSSVLASGSWAKLAIRESGIYKIDPGLLANAGLNTSNLTSSSIRLYGNGGNMLSEANSDIPLDDLTENAIMIVDGGDGLFNTGDYILFYAAGPSF